MNASQSSQTSKESSTHDLVLRKKRIKKALIAALIASFSINLLMLVSPLYMLQIYDRVLISGSESTLIMLTIIALLLLLILGGLDYARSLILVRVGILFDSTMNRSLFFSVFQKSLLKPGGGRVRALQDLEQVRHFIGSSTLNSFFDLPWIVVYLAIIYIIHPTLGHLALSGALLLLLFAFMADLVSGKKMAKASKASIASTAFADSSFQNAEIITALGMFPALEKRWQQARIRFMALQTKANDRIAAVMGCTRFIRLAVQVGILGLGAFLAIRHEISPGMMIAVSIILGRALAPVEQLIGTWRQFISARNAYRRISQLTKTYTRPKPQQIQFAPPTGQITLEKVTCVPPGCGDPVIEDLSLEINAGESIGIIGPSGAGKSSLARLIMGIWLPEEGEVRLDGVPVASWSKEKLGPHVGYLPQDVELFEGSIAENICRFGEIDSDKLLKASQEANTHEEILKFSEGYETQVSERGRSLSGGQRQRVGLARALYGSPTMVVLDEPNANLDPEGEMALKNALQELKKRKITVILIAHRPAMIHLTDRTVIIKEGKMIWQGKTTEMANRVRSNMKPKTSNMTTTFNLNHLESHEQRILA
ncbi:type I secretion system permease/ATPase [Magnetococcales bacterium HHB-1]